MATIRDVAHAAAVSPATVSRILNEDPTFKVVAATRQNVLAAAAKLNYTPPTKAPLIKRRQRITKATIGVITLTDHEHSALDDPYWEAIRNGLQHSAAVKHLPLAFLFSLRDAQPNWQLVKQCGAVIVVGAIDDELRTYLWQQNPHLVVIDDHRPGQRYDTVYNDFAQQTHHLLDYLYARGYREIGFIGASMPLFNRQGMASEFIDDGRYTAYLEWMARHNLALPIAPLILPDGATQTAIEALNFLITQGAKLPQAMIAASDQIALGLYHVCQAQNITLPTQMAIVSFGDLEVTRFLMPPLTTIQPNPAMMGQVALNLAAAHLQGAPEAPVRVRVASTLVERDSVGLDKRDDLG